jgi:hypothetical protein
MVVEAVVFKVPQLVVEAVAAVVAQRWALPQQIVGERLVALHLQHPPQQLHLLTIEERAEVTAQLLLLRRQIPILAVVVGLARLQHPL